MIRGAWMSPREDSEAQLRICCCAPRQTDKPTTDSERAQRWRLSLASLLFFTVLLSDHLWLCAAAKDRGSPAGGEHHQRQPWQAEVAGGGSAEHDQAKLAEASHPHSASPSQHRLLGQQQQEEEEEEEEEMVEGATGAGDGVEHHQTSLTKTSHPHPTFPPQHHLLGQQQEEREVEVEGAVATGAGDGVEHHQTSLTKTSHPHPTFPPQHHLLGWRRRQQEEGEMEVGLGGRRRGRRGSCDLFLSNQTKFAAPDLPCPDPHPTSFPDLESACTKLHSLPFRLAFRASPSKGDFLRAYFGNFSLSFCDSYSLLDLLLGMANPDSLDCSWDNLILDFGIGFGLGPGLAVGDHDQDGKACSSCIQAYQRLDQHAQEKYEELDSVFEKYFQSEDYSVRSCMGECKAIYKAWLCSEYFNVTQHQCHQRIPCKQYCVEVQTRCPFILPDNEDLVYGGLPSFICTGLLEKQLTNGEPECCDVRWSSCETPPSDSEQNTPTKSMESASPYHARTSPLLSSSSGPRLCNGRLRLCMLVLMLLHTVVSFSTAHSVGLETLSTIDESSTREE
ncbi:NALCN channel auxiliary factor 2 [Latimeria chalumnae]|uniref:NALCN channel auxiliary factor 2 n=1 Tax=Latimeria chalumnae TaxID=7897 RepID=UPI0003C170B3|nr:PREDICTED: transmembrane protein FAM155B [Latimeria chalumnae]|eukprot:XP_005997216.1 PREDICTED: transmembrane protein FAM155B [Latimeria chalumnae]